MANATVEINGETREIPADCTVAELATRLDLPETGVAIAVDDAVIVAGAWATTVLRGGERIDVLTAVQGG